MRRNVRRLNREVGSLNASQAAAKRKGGAGTASKSAKKSKDNSQGYSDASVAEEDAFHLPNLPLSSFASDGKIIKQSRQFAADHCLPPSLLTQLLPPFLQMVLTSLQPIHWPIQVLLVDLVDQLMLLWMSKEPSGKNRLRFRLATQTQTVTAKTTWRYRQALCIPLIPHPG